MLLVHHLDSSTVLLLDVRARSNGPIAGPLPLAIALEDQVGYGRWFVGLAPVSTSHSEPATQTRLHTHTQLYHFHVSSPHIVQHSSVLKRFLAGALYDYSMSSNSLRQQRLPQPLA